MSPDGWVIVTGILAASSCALIGSFLVLRQESMLGDAISHAVLPGLVIAFLITSSRNVLPMLIGAAISGVLTAYLTELLGKTGRLYKDASMGIVFTLLFSIGVILVSLYTGQVDLDQECVLYGEIAYVPWDSFIYGGVNYGPRAVWILGVVLVLDLLFILLFFKQIKISSFDPQFAQASGLSPNKWRYALMTMVALTVVAAFESVGAILVVAMLIVPGATAYLLADRLSMVLALSVIVGICCAIGGFLGASYFDTSISGFMAVVAGIIFVIVAVVSSVIRSIHRRSSAHIAPSARSASDSVL